MTSPRIYLDHFLEPLRVFLDRDDVTDIMLNAPGEVWVETLGGATELRPVPELDTVWIDRLIAQIAAAAHQGINRENPLLSASLPSGPRVQIVLPPATRGDAAIAIRKHQATNLTLADYSSSGAFEVKSLAQCSPLNDVKRLAKAGDYAQALAVSVKARLNILVSGGTSTGKTTFLNALLKEIDDQERLILIEDAPELLVTQPNWVGLIAPRGHLGEAAVTMEDLLNAALRMRPDRIILGELRGPEAFTFLRAVNTGHPGSMTTIHADSPERAVEQLDLLVLQSGTKLDKQSINDYVRSSIDVYVQLGRKGGRRIITGLELRA